MWGSSIPPVASDWRATVTVEERQEVRRKIRAAYLAQTQGYDELLQVRRAQVMADAQQGAEV